ncbi:hypothetical protein D3C71_1471400 [compost metagenome]
MSRRCAATWGLTSWPAVRRRSSSMSWAPISASMRARASCGLPRARVKPRKSRSCRLITGRAYATWPWPCAMAFPPPARPAPGWARCSAWRPISTSTRRSTRARWCWRDCGRARARRQPSAGAWWPCPRPVNRCVATAGAWPSTAPARRWWWPMAWATANMRPKPRWRRSRCLPGSPLPR